MLHLFQKQRIFKLVKITPTPPTNPETANRLKLNKNININKKNTYIIYTKINKTLLQKRLSLYSQVFLFSKTGQFRSGKVQFCTKIRHILVFLILTNHSIAHCIKFQNPAPWLGRTKQSDCVLFLKAWELMLLNRQLTSRNYHWNWWHHPENQS